LKQKYLNYIVHEINKENKDFSPTLKDIKIHSKENLLKKNLEHLKKK